jgi:hypothetical protein
VLEREKREPAMAVMLLALVLGAAATAGAQLVHDTDLDVMPQSVGVRFVGNETPFFGSMQGDQLGIAVTGGGDIDGDRVQDFVLAANDAIAGKGQVYVIYGVRSAAEAAAAWPTDSTALSIASDKARGRIIQGGTYVGMAVSILGDLNGDAYDDLAITGSIYSVYRMYIVFGKPRAQAISPLLVTSLDTSTIIEITGFWSSTRAAGGDWNCDGFVDIAIGDLTAQDYAGRVYVIWGGTAVWNRTTFSVGSVGTASTPGVVFTGESKSWLGSSVANAGDVNGDGCSDLIIGAPWMSFGQFDNYDGRAYIVFGKNASAWPTNGTGTFVGAGVIIDGWSQTGSLGKSVSGNVDLNGDKLSDVIIGAPGESYLTRYKSGIVYVVFGNTSLPSWIGTRTATFFDGTKGLRLYGELNQD